MLSSAVVRSTQCLRAHVTSQIRRNICVTAALTQKATASPDLIQQLFVTKIREYSEKSKKAGGLVDADPAAEATLKQELEKLTTQFGAKGQDFTKFPSFNFADKELDMVYTDPTFLEMFVEPDAEIQEIAEDEEEVPYYEKMFQDIK